MVGAKIYFYAAASTAPMLIDADGLHWLKLDHQLLRSRCLYTPCWRSGNVVIDIYGTHRSGPHKGGEVSSDCLRVHAVLKGPGSVVITGTSVHICAHGGPAMATAGMGDVLSGMCGFARAGICSGQH